MSHYTTRAHGFSVCFARATGKVLTAKQEKVLWLAIKLGFFDVPRKIHTRELSKKLVQRLLVVE
jgi:predicted DNA binding protein